LRLTLFELLPKLGLPLVPTPLLRLLMLTLRVWLKSLLGLTDLLTLPCTPLKGDC